MSPQPQTPELFSEFVASLPPVISLNQTDTLYVLHNGVSVSATVSQVAGGGGVPISGAASTAYVPIASSGTASAWGPLIYSQNVFANQAAAWAAAVAAGYPMLGTNFYNAGTTGGVSAQGLYSPGHLAIGNLNSGTDAFIGIRGAEAYENPGQEMRGVSYQVNHYFTAGNLDGAWDSLPIVGTSVINPLNTANITGQMAGVRGEIILNTGASPYTVNLAYNLQATSVSVGSNVTLATYNGLIINTPSISSGGSITNGYGIEINAITGPTNAAAIKLDGTGVAGQLLWPNTAVFDNGFSHQITGPVCIIGSWSSSDTTESVHLGFGTAISGGLNTAFLAALQAGVSYHPLEIDGSTLYLNHNSGGALNVNGSINFSASAFQTAGILVNDNSGNVTSESSIASASTPGNFSANRRLPINIGGTTYYVPLDTATW